MTDSIHTFTLPTGEVDLDLTTGALAAIRVADTEFVRPVSGTGLLRVAYPLAHYQSHFLETGTHGAPDADIASDTLTLRYPSLTSSEGTFPIHVTIRIQGSDDGLLLSATVVNGTDRPIPQIIFPQLMDLEAVSGEGATRLQLGRHRMLPFQTLQMRPDNARWMDGPLNTYFPFGDFEFNMKWFDYGDAQRGLTLFTRDTRHTTQGLVVHRPDRADTRMNLRWAHYPSLAPGESWESGEWVLFPHPGDWYAGARAYQAFTREAYPSNAPRRIQETLAIRSLWPAPRNAPPTFRFNGLPDYAEEVADPDLGIAEIVFWHWWYRNGYPVTVDEHLGTESDLASALARCDEIGVPIALFFSHHILRDTDETDHAWVHMNAGNQTVVNNWTYGRDFLPMFRPPFSGTHAMINGTALSPEWRRIGLEAYEHYLGIGGKGICFDVGKPAPDPCFNPAIDAPQDNEGEKLLEFHRAARALVHAVAPEGSYSAEHVCDVNVPVYDYTWEWFNGYDIADAAPFRYVFPQFRLNANVNEHPRGALIAFMESALLNIMPGNMSSYRLRDCPDLVAMLKRLQPLRQRFLHWFTEGQFHHLEGLTVTGGDARLYSHNGNLLVIAINPTDVPADVTVTLDPAVWGEGRHEGQVTVTGLDGNDIRSATSSSNDLTCTVSLAPDTLAVIEFLTRETSHAH